MSNYKFSQDIVLGNEAENKLLDIFHNNGYPKAYRVLGKEVRWDIIIPEINKSVEVKNDLLATSTGNLAIEVNKQNGELSGIMASQADFWVIFANNEIYMFDRIKLKNYCLNKQHRKVMGGDRFATEMILVKIDEIKKQDFYRRIG